MVLCRRWPRSLRKDNVSAPNTPRDSHAMGTKKYLAILLLLLLFYIIVYHLQDYILLHVTEGLHSSYTLHNALKRKASFTLPQHHQMPGQCAWSSPVRRRWYCVKRSTWSSETALGSCSSYVALIRRGDSSLFVATPEVNPSAPSPDRKVQTSGRTSSNKSAPCTYIVASAKDGK